MNYVNLILSLIAMISFIMIFFCLRNFWKKMDIIFSFIVAYKSDSLIKIDKNNQTIFIVKTEGEDNVSQ